MAEDPQSRRAALKTIAWLAAGAAGLWRFLTPQSTSTAAAPVVARTGDVPANGALVMPQHGLAIVRNEHAISAVALACTHLGCVVNAGPAGFACPCHGSRFDRSGARIAGPAPSSLRQLKVDERDGIVIVEGATETRES